MCSAVQLGHGQGRVGICPATRFSARPGTVPERLYGQMALIRRFEERLLELFEEGLLVGTTHASIGQEGDPVGVINHLRDGDIVFSNHRCHGHFLVYADDPGPLLAEIMGRAGGLVGGRGGSQHIHRGNFYSNGIQGGIVANAVGMALAEKRLGTGAIVVVFLGDGTLGQGVVYEAMNMASLWSLPVLFVVEDNGWAQSTPVRLELAGSMVARGEAFGMSAGELASTDAEQLYARFGEVVSRVRASNRPHLEVIHTYRLCHHSKSHDGRPAAEVEAHRVGDPLPLLRARLDPATAQRLDTLAAQRVAEAEAWARALPHPDPTGLRAAVLEAAP